MKKKTVRDVDVAGKRVLVRVDFNVPLRDCRVFDDTRIRAALPTIEYLRGEGAKVILVSHLGRPDGREDPALRLDPVVRRLSDLLGVPVRKTAALVGLEVTEAVGALRSEGVLVLENSRFHPGETQNDQTLSKQLADLADVFVNDAFGAAHRAHATTAGVAEHLPAVAGLLMEKELGVLDSLLSNPKRPFVVVLGGIKVSEKIGVIRKFLQFADDLLIGGAMCFTFFAAQGWQVGSSRVESEEGVAAARRVLDEMAESDCTLHLPQDVLLADRFEADAELRTARADTILNGWMGVDVGQDTALDYGRIIAGAGQVFWNGPMGAFEILPFGKGTRVVAQAMANCGGVTVVGGGDSLAAVNSLGLSGEMDHVSTGGGASLEYLEGSSLPGLDALEDA